MSRASRLPSAAIQKIRGQFERLKRSQPEIRLEWPPFEEKLVRIVEHHSPSFSANPGGAGSIGEDSILSLLDQLHWEELFLTTACAEGNEQAWNTFHARYQDWILKAARSCASNSAAAEELAVSLMTGLYFQPDAAPPTKSGKIAQYHGIGSLEGWLRVIVTRMCIDQARSELKKVSLDDMQADLPDSAPRANTARLVEERESQEAATIVHESLSRALDELAPKERLVLNLYYLENLNLKDLGKLLKVHESTVSRMVEKTRQRLRKSMERQLRQRFHVKSREMPLYLEIAATHCDIDVKRLLAK